MKPLLVALPWVAAPAGAVARCTARPAPPSSRCPMRAKLGAGLVLLPALCIALAAGPARAEDGAAGMSSNVPAASQALDVPPPVAEHAPETLAPITVHGRRIEHPSVHDILQRDLHRDESVRFETVDTGDGHRCTRVQPFGYEQCTNGPALFEFRVG